MDWIALGELHSRLRKAQLPGWTLQYDEGPDRWSAEISTHDGGQLYIREHSAPIFLEALAEALTEAGA